MKGKVFLAALLGLMLFAGGSALAQPDFGITDTVDLVLVPGDQPDAGSSKYTFKLELWAFFDDSLKGMNCGFTWNNSPNPALLVLDSAGSPAVIEDDWFDLAVGYFEDGSLATTNANKRFYFAGARLFGIAPGDASGRRLIATYHFSVDPTWSTSDVIVIDTNQFNANSVWTFINKVNPPQGFKPVWPYGPGGSITIADVSSATATGGAVPNSFSLSQNYPNPFNPTTTIEFSVPSREWVRLDVFNVLGQKVNTLLDAPLDANTYKVEWDGTDQSGGSVASGIYFYKLTAGEHVDTRKMMLLK